MPTMSSRERVLKAFRHEEPDRTPIFELYGVQPPTADMVLGRPGIDFARRMDYLAEGDWQGPMDRAARDLVDLAKAFHWDMVGLGPNLPRDYERPVKVGENLWRTADSMTRSLHLLGHGDALTRYVPESGWKGYTPLVPKSVEQLEAEMLAEIEKEYEPPALGGDQLYVFREVKRMLREEGLDLAIAVSAYSLPVAWLHSFMLDWFYRYPKHLDRFYEKYTRSATETAKRLVELGADVVMLGGDLASDAGPVLSPAHYREFLLPYVRRQADTFHQMGTFVCNVTDGNLWLLIDDFLISSRVDGYSEIDKAAGMDLGPLKQRFGDRICFLGNVDCRRTLCSGTVDEVKRETIECIQKGWGNGGHILMSSNSIHRGVKPENYLAMVEAHRQYFAY